MNLEQQLKEYVDGQVQLCDIVERTIKYIIEKTGQGVIDKIQSEFNKERILYQKKLKHYEDVLANMHESTGCLFDIEDEVERDKARTSGEYGCPACAAFEMAPSAP